MSLCTDSDFNKSLRKVGFVLGVAYLALTGGGGCNAFTTFGNEYTDDAKIQQAQMQIDAGQWTGAILTLNTLSLATQSQGNIQLLFATAYAGRGGLNLITLSQKIQNLPGGISFFKMLMQVYTGATAANVADEITAESYIQNISVNAANRTVDQNVFMVFLEMAKIGTIVGSTASPAGNGLLSGAFDSCLSLTNAYADQIVTGISNIVASFAAAGLSVGAGLIGPIATDCASLGGMCAVFTVAGVTPLMERFAKTLVGETALGIGLPVPAETGICEIPPAGANCHGSGTGLCP